MLDWVFLLLMSVPMSQIREGGRGLLFCSDVPPGDEPEIIQTYLECFATRGRYTIKVSECKAGALDGDKGYPASDLFETAGGRLNSEAHYSAQANL